MYGIHDESRLLPKKSDRGLYSHRKIKSSTGFRQNRESRPDRQKPVQWPHSAGFRAATIAHQAAQSPRLDKSATLVLNAPTVASSMGAISSRRIYNTRRPTL